MSEPLVVFTNPGTIDPRSIKSFGVSVKEGSNPIGYFGTGLKYALAIFARLGHDITIHSGKEVFTIGVRSEGIRGKEFQFITMNGEELSFTTELGKNWEPWQAFREIYCNCIDEGGTVELTDLIPMTEDGVTRIIIRGREATLGFHERNEIVLSLPAHLRLADGNVEVFNRPSQFLYYRGVRVMKLKQQAQLTYNIIETQSLTEDRTLSNPGGAVGRLVHGICKIKDRRILRKVILADRDTFEANLDFDWLNYGSVPELSEEFEQVLEEGWEHNDQRMNRTANKYYRTLRDKKALLNFVEEAMTPVEEMQLNKCLKILPQVFPGFNDYDVLVVKSLGTTVHAFADKDGRRMVLSKAAFKLGTKYLMATMIEEFMHLKTGYGDQTRELQTHLFDSLVTLIEDHVLKEPV